jgi:primosomal protein N' (replication factor Y)
VAGVVIALGVRRVFSYAVPAALTGVLQPGQRVRVPFRGRARPGVVVDLGMADVTGLQAIEAALDPVPALTPALLALAHWAAEETATAWGEAVLRAVPPGTPSDAPGALPPWRPAWPDAGARLVHGAGRAGSIEAAIDRALGDGGGVLVLAPEIEAAAAWADRLAARARGAVVLATSAETPRRRWRAWWAARTGAARVAVGTRGAAFWPLAPLALAVVLDEEDPAHKAPDGPRWHARELALRRVAIEGGAALLASAAPSLESWVRAQAGAMRAEEARAGPGPAVHVVDLGPTGDPAPALSAGLREAAAAALAGGRAVTLIVERVGFGRALACAECGAVRRCQTCRVALTYHRAARVLECRLCGQKVAAWSLCGRCRGRRLAPVGWGTEALEAEARRAFPGALVVRYDGTLDPAAAGRARAAAASGQAQVLVGTRMAVRLLEAGRPVGVAALALADATLALPDFRAGERTFQLLGRLAETVAPGGSLWVQTHHPDHHAFRALAAGARDRFYAAEWTERQELGYPPARRMARIVAEGRAAAGAAETLAERARAAGLTVLGPAALAGRRTQVVLLGDGALPGAVAAVLAPLRGRRRLGATRLVVDVDPVELP